MVNPPTVIVATTRVRSGLKSSAVERGVDLGDHFGRRWLPGIGKCLEGDNDSGNPMNKMLLSAAIALVPVLVECLGQ